MLNKKLKFLSTLSRFTTFIRFQYPSINNDGLLVARNHLAFVCPSLLKEGETTQIVSVLFLTELLLGGSVRVVVYCGLISGVG